MLSKNAIKDIQSLYQKKQREQTGLFIAEGPKLAEELLKSTYAVEAVYATEAWSAQHPQQSCTIITASELERISQLQTPNQVLIVAKQQRPLQPPVPSGRLTLVLDGIQDPGNMGTIIRIADWFGVSQIICSTDSAEKYNPKVVQASMGSIVRINCWYEDLEQWTVPADLPVYGALLNGENVFAAGKSTEGLLIIGNESKGIREPLLSAVTHPVTIPRIGGAESLNAAVATGIILGCLTNG